MTGGEFKEARKEWGLSQSEMGDLLGVHPRTVSAWEQNRQTIPATVALLIAHTGVLVARLRLKLEDRAKG